MRSLLVVGLVTVGGRAGGVPVGRDTSGDDEPVGIGDQCVAEPECLEPVPVGECVGGDPGGCTGEVGEGSRGVRPLLLRPGQPRLDDSATRPHCSLSSARAVSSARPLRQAAKGLGRGQSAICVEARHSRRASTTLTGAPPKGSVYLFVDMVQNRATSWTGSGRWSARTSGKSIPSNVAVQWAAELADERRRADAMTSHAWGADLGTALFRPSAAPAGPGTASRDMSTLAEADQRGARSIMLIRSATLWSSGPPTAPAPGKGPWYEYDSVSPAAAPWTGPTPTTSACARSSCVKATTRQEAWVQRSAVFRRELDRDRHAAGRTHWHVGARRAITCFPELRAWCSKGADHGDDQGRLPRHGLLGAHGQHPARGRRHAGQPADLLRGAVPRAGFGPDEVDTPDPARLLGYPSRCDPG